MKKKHYSKYSIIRFQKNRAKKIERMRRKRKFRKNKYNKKVAHDSLSKIPKQFNGYCSISAPQCFSLIENESKTLDFLEKLARCHNKKKKVLVRLEGVTKMSADAIVVLLSSMVRFKSSNIDFNGTRPLNAEARNKLEKSGFFDYLYNDFKKQADYVFNNLKSRIYTHGEKTVSSDLADDLIMNASKSLWDEQRRCQGAQKTLVELMHNTYDHASLQKGEKHWWLSVEHDRKNKEVIFSFIDFGMGIYESLENKSPDNPLYKAWNLLKKLNPLAKSQVELIRLILEGQLHRSQSGDYYRGKGLAKIYALNKANKISSLCIISNKAYINVEKDDYHSIDNEFKGTFISFKINTNTVSLPWTI